MPTVFRLWGMRFFFYADDHLPVHIHVAPAKGDFPTCKIQVDPVVKVISSAGFNRKDLGRILESVLNNRELIIDEWHAFFKE